MKIELISKIQYGNQYKDFIDAAKEYQARVLGYVPYEPPETFRDYEYMTPIVQYATYSPYYYYPGYGYYQQQVQEPPSILTNLNISSAQKYQAPTVIDSPQSSMEDYINRAFEK